MSDHVALAHGRQHVAAVVDPEVEIRLTASKDAAARGRHGHETSAYTLRVKPDRRCETQPFAGGERRQRREGG